MTEESVFEAARAIADPAERAAYLDSACAGNPSQRQEVEALLLDHFATGNLLDRPALDPTGAFSARSESGESGRLAAGRMFAGRYKLREKVGEGGMGEVWVADQTEPVQRRVAVKVIRAGMDTARILARFDQERQALAVMDHPNIARIFDAGVTPDGLPYFIMEFIKGVPITRFCDDAKLTPQARLELFVPVCQAVQHAHQKGVIHRDLKPSNVLVGLYDGRPVPKVIDFGVAKATGPRLGEHSIYTEVGSIVGTLEYMSPEQAELNNLDIDTRSDVYALGVLLYELLTGSVPFSRKELGRAGFAEMLRVIKEQEPPRPSTRLSGSGLLPSVAAVRQTEPKRLTALMRGELDWVVMKALEKDRSRRYETATGFAADVQRYLAGEAVLAHPPSAGYRLRKFTRRNRGAVPATVTVVVAVLAGAGVAVWQSVVATRAEAVARDETARAEDERDEKDRARQAEFEQRIIAVGQRNEAVRQKKRAEDAAVLAEAVSLFLRKDLLEQAAVANRPLDAGSPRRDPDLKVRDLLDRAAKRIEGKLQDQPLAEAAIRLTLGNTYLDMGYYEEARKHLDRALTLRERHLGDDDLETLTCMNNLGLLHHHLGQYDRAEPLLTRVVAMRTAQQGAAHQDTLITMINLAYVYRKEAKYDQAEPLILRVLEGRTAQLGADHEDTLKSQYELANLYADQGKYGRAEAMFRQVLDKQTTLLGDDHHDTLSTKTSLALTYEAQGKYDRAEPLFVQVADVTAAVKGADHPDTLTSQDNLALLYYYRKKYDLAEPIFVRVLAKRTKVLGAEHAHTLVSQHNLALLYSSQGKYDLAEPLLKDVVAKRTTLLGADHPATLGSMNNLGTLYWHGRRFQDSVPLFETVLRLQRKNPGEDHPDTISTAYNLAVNYRDAGRLAEAEATIDEWLPRDRAKRPMGHPQIQFGLTTALSIYERTGAYAKAEPLLRDLAEFQKKQHGAQSAPYASAQSSVGLILLKQQKFAEAEHVLRECVAILESTQPGSLSVFPVQSLLGGSLTGQKRYAEAEPLLLAAYAGLKRGEARIPVTFRHLLIEARDRVVQLYEAWGRPADAEKWRKELIPVQIGPMPREVKP